MNRLFVAVIAAAVIVAAVVLGALAGTPPGSSRPSNSPVLVAGATPRPPASATATSPGATTSPSPTPTPTPQPTPVLVPAPLTGRLVSPKVAAQHPIAVMIDDQTDARPQSGFNAASVVWQAPAEGGIPRYMLVFQDTIPEAVGPVRSARQYYIDWASELRALYVHVGGSPQALTTLRQSGQGQLVYNADEFRWGGRYLWRIKERFAPHNVYSDGKHLRALAKRVGAADGPIEPAWSFAPDVDVDRRPVGGRISFAYLANAIRYDYDRASNTYVRRVSGQSPQVDAADGQRVAPKNVVIMLVQFGRLNDGHPEKKRLEAQNVGQGTAWIATNGRTIKGTWRKAAGDAPTRFFDSEGRRVTLTIGQTFVQVLPVGTKVSIRDGAVPVQDPLLAEAS